MTSSRGGREGDKSSNVRFSISLSALAGVLETNCFENFSSSLVFRFWGLDEAVLMSKRPRKKDRNHYEHPNPERKTTFMSSGEVAKRPKEDYTELAIQGNIRYLSSAIWKMTRLTSLYLNNNSLTSIPGEISLLVNLVHLNVSYNSLRTIPPEMGE
ncbi:CCR4-NOT transcription complex subunit 6-like, partial [Caerostris extrusa]